MAYAQIYSKWQADPEGYWLDAAGAIDWEGKPTRACLLYTSPSPRERTRYRMPSSACKKKHKKTKKVIHLIEHTIPEADNTTDNIHNMTQMMTSDDTVYTN